MVLSFTLDNSRLLVYCDDYSLTIYDMATLAVVSTHNFEASNDDYQGCPTAMPINHGYNYVAIAWRGKVSIVWHFQSTAYTPAPIRRLPESFVSLSGPEALRSQADDALLYVMCQDTNVIEWRLYDDHYLEYPHPKARGFVISSDSSLVLTVDCTDTTCIWDFPRLSIIYKLVSMNDFVRDVAFSPDSQRLNDIRDSVCNIWKPDVLVRPDDQDLKDQSSLNELGLVTNEPTIAHINTSSGTITAIVTCDSGAYYACGKLDRSVIIHEAINGTPIRKVYIHSDTTSVLRLQWSSLGRYIVSSSESARIIVKLLESESQGPMARLPCPRHSGGRSTTPILVQSRRATSTHLHIFDEPDLRLADKNARMERELGNRKIRTLDTEPFRSNFTDMA